MSLQDMAVLRSFLIVKVLDIVDLTNTGPKSMKTGPAQIFISYSPESTPAMSRVSLWFSGEECHFFLKTKFTSGLNALIVSASLYGSYAPIGLFTYNFSFAIGKGRSLTFIGLGTIPTSYAKSTGASVIFFNPGVACFLSSSSESYSAF